MTKSTGKPRGRPPGRPRGSRDFRPHLLNLLERFKLIPVLLEELEALKDSLPAKEKVQLYLELARMGLNASPRTTEVDGGVGISLYINNVLQKSAIDGTPSPPALDVTPEGESPKALLPHEREELEKRAKSYSARPPVPRSRPFPVLTQPPPDPPPGVQVFTVPFGPDEVPPEWRADINFKGETEI